MNKPCPCPGECPDVCEACIYGLCKKPVDYALVHFRYERMISFIFTSNENEEERKFNLWFQKYFNLQ